MVKCRSWKCKKRMQEVIDRIMDTIPSEYHYDYTEVRKRAKPHLTKKDWINWLGRHPKNG